MAHLPQIDFRYRWLSETISNALGIFDTTFADQLIAEHSDLVDAFFNDNIYEKTDAHKQILFVWRTFYDKLVEESITVLEEGKIKHTHNFVINVKYNVNYLRALC